MQKAIYDMVIKKSCHTFWSVIMLFELSGYYIITYLIEGDSAFCQPEKPLLTM